MRLQAPPQAAWQLLSASSCRLGALARPRAPLQPSQRPRCASWGCLPGACRQVQGAGWCTASCIAPVGMARRLSCWLPPGDMVGTRTGWTVTRLLLVLPQAACWQSSEWLLVQQFWPSRMGIHAHSKQLQELSVLQCDPTQLLSTRGDKAPLQVLRCSWCPGCRS